MIGSFSMVQKETGRPLRFYEASLFQFINPKAWSIAVTVASGFFPSEENIIIGVAFVTITAQSLDLESDTTQEEVPVESEEENIDVSSDPVSP